MCFLAWVALALGGDPVPSLGAPTGPSPGGRDQKPSIRLSPAPGTSPAAHPAPKRKASPSPAAAPTDQPSASPQAEAAPPIPPAPMLKLDEALQISLVGNRSLQNSRLEVVKNQKNAVAAGARRLPSLQVEAHAGEMLTTVGVNFQQGAFGTYPGVGPIPATNTTITTTPKLTTYYVLAMRQPVTQLPRLNLHVKAKEIDTALAAEEVRVQRESLITDVKRSYFSILQTQASLLAAADSLRFYIELNRTVLDKYKEQTVLKTDVLDVKKHVAEAEFDLQQQRDSLATNKSQLNLLLGRDIHTDFDVQEVPESRISSLSLPELEKLALAQRPQIHQANLKVKQAELDRRITAASYSPDLDLAFTYYQPQNVGLASSAVITVGARLTWEPITWGRINNELQAKTQAILQAQNNEKQISDQVLVEVGQQYRTLHTNQERVKAARIALEAARETLRVARVRYSQQAVLLQDVYEAQTRLASATRNYLEAVLAVNIAQAELEQSIGEDE